MRNLYLFNPENDLALAANMPFFTPPSAARAFAAASSCLPLWYAQDQSDSVIVGEYDSEWLDGLREYFDIRVGTVANAPTDVLKVIPWGWSRYARMLFERAGVSSSMLPTTRTLDIYRSMSHRRQVISLYRELKRQGLPYSLPPMPLEVSDDKIIEAMLSRGNRIFIKSPWSGSGRGVLDSITAPSRQLLRQAGGVIKRQGSVIVEEGLDKILDFAMLYEMEAGMAKYVGLSVFENVSYSIYGGNILASEEDLKLILCNYVGDEVIDATRETVGKALQHVIGAQYEGPVGVDMLIYRVPGGLMVDPCVEINLRMTMGRVAHDLSAKYLAPGSVGRMEMVQPSRMPRNKSFFDQCVIDDHHIVTGSIPLTSPGQWGIGVEMTVRARFKSCIGNPITL